MRIPSQLNDQNLYRRDNRRRESSQNYRRVFRMLLGLALVLVVMRQASKPAIYQPFFGAQVSPVANGGGALSEPEPISPSLLKTQSLIKTAVPADDRSVANQLVGALQASDQQQWAALLTSWLTESESNLVPSTLQNLREKLDEIELPDEQRVAWDNLFGAISSSSQVPSADEGQIKILAMLGALETAISSRVVDGSVWSSGDVGAFYLHLAQAQWQTPDGIAAVGVLPLLQQPDVFLGQLVRVHGGVARCERMDAQPNSFNVEEYWQLWLRPNDGADRPITVIVPSVPPNVAKISSDGSSEEGPQVIVLGKFLKRLSYASTRGAELAPAIVGRLTAVPIESNANAVDQPEAMDGNRDWLVLVLASLGGLALAVIAMYRTAVTARHSRALRNSNQKKPDDFLNELGSPNENS